MVGWHHWHSGHEFEQIPGIGDGQGGMVCFSPWGHKESDMTEWLDWTDPNRGYFNFINLILLHFVLLWASLVAQMVKNLPAMLETWVRSLDWEDTLEKGTATHSNILAWRIPLTQEPHGLQSMGSQRVRHDWATFTFSKFTSHFYKIFMEIYVSEDSHLLLFTENILLAQSYLVKL